MIFKLDRFVYETQRTQSSQIRTIHSGLARFLLRTPYRKGDLDFSPPSNDDGSPGGRRKGTLDAPEAVEEEFEVARIRMPGALPKQDDSYLCTSFQTWNLTAGRQVYIRSFQAEATARKAHHIILQKCDNPPQPPGQVW